MQTRAKAAPEVVVSKGSDAASEVLTVGSEMDEAIRELTRMKMVESDSDEPPVLEDSCSDGGCDAGEDVISNVQPTLAPSYELSRRRRYSPDLFFVFGITQCRPRQ